jgi:hypothetical protein
VKLNWSVIGSIVAALAGVLGTILTPLYGTDLSSQIQSVLQALSALLVAIPAWHIGSVASANAKATHAARLAVTTTLKPLE